MRDALPLWATAGFDPRTGRFCEALTLDGAPLREMPTRLIVQARQVFSYALAAKRNWYADAAAMAEAGYRSMVRDYHSPDGRPGWVYSVHGDGAVADGRRDLYSHAFALLAISAFVGMTGRREAIVLADETLEFIDGEMRAPLSGGYVECLPTTSDVRRQNPHMHLLEAMLSLWTTTGEARYLARAGEMFGLFTSRFFRPVPGIVGEYFDEALEPAKGPAGEIAEPGHHCEWIWLLRWFSRETARDVDALVDPLYDHAARYGYDSAGLLVDEVMSDGTHLTRSHRTWPMTEAIKANVVEASAGRAGAVARAGDLAALLFDVFFKPAHPGGWLDRIAADGRPVAREMPASTLYHVLGAIDLAVNCPEPANG